MSPTKATSKKWIQMIFRHHFKLRTSQAPYVRGPWSRGCVATASPLIRPCSKQRRFRFRFSVPKTLESTIEFRFRLRRYRTVSVPAEPRSFSVRFRPSVRARAFFNPVANRRPSSRTSLRSLYCARDIFSEPGTPTPCTMRQRQRSLLPEPVALIIKYSNRNDSTNNNNNNNNHKYYTYLIPGTR